MIDNASYNRAQVPRERLAKPERRLRVVYLPPYAPNLNLSERLWWFCKMTTLWSRHYPSFVAFREAIRGFFDKLEQWQAELPSLPTSRFHAIKHKTAQLSAV